MKLILIIGLLIILPLCFAELEAKEFMVDTNIPISMPCVNNGSLCSATAKCNISIYYPNSTQLTKSQGMTNDLGIFNFTINSSFTKTPGRYDTIVNCNDAPFSGSTMTYFFIRRRIITTPMEGTRLIGVIFGLLIMIAAFFIMAMQNKHKFLKWACSVLAMTQLVMILGVIWINERGANIEGLLKINFYIFGIIAGGLFLLTLYYRMADIGAGDTQGETDKWR